MPLIKIERDELVAAKSLALWAARLAIHDAADAASALVATLKSVEPGLGGL